MHHEHCLSWDLCVAEVSWEAFCRSVAVVHLTPGVDQLVRRMFCAIQTRLVNTPSIGSTPRHVDSFAAQPTSLSWLHDAPMSRLTRARSTGTRIASQFRENQKAEFMFLT